MKDCTDGFLDPEIPSLPEFNSRQGSMIEKNDMKVLPVKPPVDTLK